MSVTTTSNPLTSGVLHALADYDLHHSTSLKSTTKLESSDSRETPLRKVHSPVGWPTDHRRVPPYRPINRHLDMEQRPGGLDRVEAIFIMTMLNGVRLNSILNTAWRATGGKINKKIFYYEIGGEW